MADDAGALLVRSGLVSTSALDDARSRSDELGGTIGEHLVFANAMSDDALTDFYKQRLLVPQVNPNTLARLPIRVVAAIPQDMAIELRAVPVALDNDNNLTVAMSDPSDSNAVDEIAFFTGAYVVRAVATQMQIAWCLAHYYGHVTPLGQRLLQTNDAPPAPISAPRPRQKGLTGKVDAMRHRGIVPATGPVNPVRPTSGEIPLPVEVAPMPVPVVQVAPSAVSLPPEVTLDTNPTIIPNRNAATAIAAPVPSSTIRPKNATPASAEAAGMSAPIVVPTALPTAKTIPEFLLGSTATPEAIGEADTPSDGIPDSKHPRPRSISGEIRVPKARAESIKPVVEEDPYTDDEEDGPVITMEVNDDDPIPEIEEETSPRKRPAPRRRVVKSNPPELAARAGEVQMHVERSHTVDEGPRIIISDELDDPKPDAAGEIKGRAHRDSDMSAPTRTIEVSEDDSEGVVIHERIEPESTPILLDRAKPPSNPQALLPKPPVLPDDTDVVELGTAKKKKEARPIREAKRTQIGMGAVPAVTTRSHRDTDAGSIPEMVDDAPTQVNTAPNDDPTTVDTLAAPEHTPATLRHAIEAALGEDDDDDVAEPPPPVAQGGLGQLARPIHTPKWAEHEDLDDGWGPPGSTIPPPLLGAIPGTGEDDDEDGVPGRIPVSDVDSAPLIVGPPAAPEVSRGSPRPETASSTPVRALEDATSRMIEMIRTLEHAQSRDEVVSIMVTHLAETHRRAGFFMIKPIAPKGASELGVFSIEPRPATLPYATLRLDSPSTLQDVVGTRLPYRGPMHDAASRQFLANVLGACPPEILLVPVAVRDRVVGVLFGEHRMRHTFDDQLSIASRAAGMALERVLKSKRGS